MVAGDGRSFTVDVALAADAPRTLRRMRVVAGSATVPFTLPELANFLVTELQPEVDSVSPIVLITGDPPLTFFMRGRNLQNATAIRFVPATGIVVGSNLNVNASGTEATVSITVAPTAPVGNRVAVIETPAEVRAAPPEQRTRSRSPTALRRVTAGSWHHSLVCKTAH